MTSSLESKTGYYPYLHLLTENSNHLNRNEHYCYKWELSEWSEVEEGDQVLVVGQGKYYGYLGEWKRGLTEEDWEEDDDMLHNRPYLRTDEDYYLHVHDAMKAIEDDYPDIYLECLEYFGFDDGDKYRIATHLEIAMGEFEDQPKLFDYLQCIYACL